MTVTSTLIPHIRSNSDCLGLVLAVYALLLAPLGLLAAKAVVPLTLAAALAGGLALRGAGMPWRIVDRSLAAVLAVFVAWCFVAAAWSPRPAEAVMLAARIGVLVSALLYLAALARQIEPRQQRWVLLGFGVGFAAAVGLIVLELSFHTPLFNLLKGTTDSDYAAISRLNRGVSAVAILAWPLAAVAWHRNRPALAVLLPAAVFAVTLFSESSASAFALALGLPAAALSLLGRKTARIALALAAAGALFATPLVIDEVQRSELPQSDLLPETGVYRLHVWEVVSQRVAERPVFGWGFDASPNLPTADAKPFRPGEKVIPSHPHNGGLQIMVELGLIGSLLALAVLFAVGQRIDRLNRGSRACAVGMTVTILVVACTAYGLWQSHWLAVIGAAAALFTALQAPDPET